MDCQESETMRRLPAYLRAFVVTQDYQKYTPREQATWRFIMRHAREFFKKHAHPVYLEGLKQTGIPISRIPNIEEMDAVLKRFGWGAVCVRGFIPPLAFLDFQARKILPIAADMRSIEQIAYTPAPDIVHEAAGHAPIIADEAYREYLTRYAQLARKAIFSSEDVRLYEAIRHLSDVKANPDSLPKHIAAAEEVLQEAVATITWISEAAKVSRMNWWTVEYGLIGPLETPQIYGAGLLSSLSESRQCLSAQVEKRPLQLACVDQSYDITRPQPQLYVAQSFEHLTRVLAELEETLSFRQGGLSSLLLAQRAATVTTTVLDSGLEISGVVDQVESSESSAARETATFVRWRGPVQLCVQACQLPGHGRERHGHGFSSPLGPWRAFPQKDPAQLTDEELTKAGFVAGQRARLEFNSGFVVEGCLEGWTRHQGSLVLMTWSDCTVSQGGVLYFQPAWGDFDLAVGHKLPSVYGGPADWQAFGDYDLGQASSTPARSSPFTKQELQLFDLYTAVRALRHQGSLPGADKSALRSELETLARTVTQEFPVEWLLAIEIVEIAAQVLGWKWQESPVLSAMHQVVLNPQRYEEASRQFIAMGLALAAVAD